MSIIRVSLFYYHQLFNFLAERNASWLTHTKCFVTLFWKRSLKSAWKYTSPINLCLEVFVSLPGFPPVSHLMHCSLLSTTSSQTGFSHEAFNKRLHTCCLVWDSRRRRWDKNKGPKRPRDHKSSQNCEWHWCLPGFNVQDKCFWTLSYKLLKLKVRLPVLPAPSLLLVLEKSFILPSKKPTTIFAPAFPNIS